MEQNKVRPNLPKAEEEALQNSYYYKNHKRSLSNHVTKGWVY
jgi:hypothetical protein